MITPERVGLTGLASPLLCLVTDRRRFGEDRLERIVDAAVSGGVNMVQLREKDLSDDGLLPLALRLRELTRGRALLLVNGSVEVALESEADGIHLGEAQPFAIDRGRLPEGFLIGRSAHSAEGARKAEDEGADFVIAGHVFATASHPGELPRGLGFLRGVRAVVSLPLIAIGGVDESNAGQCIRAGADGVAIISAIGCANDPQTAARHLMDEMREALEARRNDRTTD